jgi:hypothetical protein
LIQHLSPDLQGQVGAALESTASVVSSQTVGSLT